MIMGQIGYRPQLHILGKGNTNNTGLGGFGNPSVTGVSNTTGIFSESNGALNFNGAGQFLEWGASVYDEIIDYANAGTLSFYTIMNNAGGVTGNDLLLSGGVTGNQTGTIGVGLYAGFASVNGLIYSTGANQTVNSINKLSYTILRNQWASYNFITQKNTTFYDGTIYENGIKLSLSKDTSNQLMTKATGAGRNFRIGWRYDNPTGRSFLGKLVDFRMYVKDLPQIAQTILWNNKGRVAA